jgi:hypothetical protein
MFKSFNSEGEMVNVKYALDSSLNEMIDPLTIWVDRGN